MDFKNPITHKILLASVPIFIIGFLFRDYIETAFMSALLVAGLLVINGCVLMVNLFIKRSEEKKDAKEKPKKLNTKNALIIGLFHVFALLPGISRSGTTITTGRVLGLDWKRAAKFSFFISFIPIAGAAWFKIITSYHEFEFVYILGFFVAFIVGYSSIEIMMRILRAGKFHYFGIYTIIIGIIILVVIL
jgi:undecaprenyl-diphosphatase